jgi:hypothetical protein
VLGEVIPTADAGAVDEACRPIAQAAYLAACQKVPMLALTQAWLDARRRTGGCLDSTRGAGRDLSPSRTHPMWNLRGSVAGRGCLPLP